MSRSITGSSTAIGAPVMTAGAGQGAPTAAAQVFAGRVDGSARGQTQPGLAGHAGGAQLSAEVAVRPR